MEKINPLDASYRTFFFTSYKVDEIAARMDFWNYSWEKSKFKYLLMGLETCPSTGRLHIQGYGILKKVTKGRTIAKELGDEVVHCASRNGSHEQAVIYCKKENNFVEFGNPGENNQGKRSDLDNVWQDIESGMSLLEVTLGNRNAYARYSKGINQVYTAMRHENRNWKTEVIYIVGATGSGKSKLAHEMTRPETTYEKDEDSKWWDGYDPFTHEDIIIDDFKGQMSLSKMLKIMDRYPMQVEIKGGYVPFLGKRIIITSIFEFKYWYHDDRDRTAVDQLERRIDRKIELGVTVTKVAGNTMPPLSNAFDFS